MERALSETLRPSAADLREEAWELLRWRNSTSNPDVRRDLALRVFELAQSAARLWQDAGQ